MKDIQMGAEQRGVTLTPFTTQEIEAAVKQGKMGKSVGMDPGCHCTVPRRTAVPHRLLQPSLDGTRDTTGLGQCCLQSSRQGPSTDEC